jgi:deazaflavin-dependent oxidoreductase (nitroreductase family)
MTNLPAPAAARSGVRAPGLIRLSGPIARRLLRAGIPMGPNGILTVRGRTTGQPRSAPVAVVELDGRQWIIGTFGEVHWVRNLRAAGEADLELHGTRHHLRGRELGLDERIAFFAETLPAYVRSLPVVWRRFVGVFLRTVAPAIHDDPAAAAATRPVFELL